VQQIRTDVIRKIQIQWKWILAGSITSLLRVKTIYHRGLRHLTH